MTASIIRVPFSESLLDKLQSDLQTMVPAAQTGNFSGVLVLLPSSRACGTLRNLLLDKSGHQALLLPQITTIKQFINEAAALTGFGNVEVPGDKIRSILLAKQLVDLPWLAGRAESAPGLATEFITLFDEARLYRQEKMLFDVESTTRMLEIAGAADAEFIAGDLARIHEAWGLYRRVIAHDHIDQLIAAVESIIQSNIWPGVKPNLTLIAGLGRVDPIQAEFLRFLIAQDTKTNLYLQDVQHRLSRLVAATWGEKQSATNPLATARHIEKVLTGSVSLDQTEKSGDLTLRERLAEIGQTPDLLAPTGHLELRSCGNLESESLDVTDQVVQILQEANGSEKSIGIAVADPSLAARITLQLRDAGIDCDNTHGEVLSAQPAGLLTRFILRAALTDLRAEPLLEALANPFVKLDTGVGSHGLWSMRLERLLRSSDGPRGGLAGLFRRAEEQDEAARKLFESSNGGMLKFVSALALAFEPLLSRQRGTYSWREMLGALEKSWSLLAADYSLTDSSERADVAKLTRLLGDLHRDSDRLRHVTLADFSADLQRLMAGETAPAHRTKNLPIIVLGMIEARLERFDVLLIVGMREGVFPAKTKKPLLLNSSLRKKLNLPLWQESLARDAELFTRLLHAGKKVILSWSEEDSGSTALRSGFISRLIVATGAPDNQPPVGRATLWRKLWREEDSELPEIAASVVQPEALAPGVAAFFPIRSQFNLSWSALRQWRDCPYRFLLSRGYVLRPTEDISQEFGRMEMGNLVHEVLCTFHKSDGAGYSSLVAGNAQKAESILLDIAKEKFLGQASVLPVLQLWYESFLTCTKSIVDYEIERYQIWRPVLLEKKFELPFLDLLTWLRRQVSLHDLELKVLDEKLLPDYAHKINFVGTIDRVDQLLTSESNYSVIDYKTGAVPTNKSVKDLKDLQILLYAAAVECGALPVEQQWPNIDDGFYYTINGEKSGMFGSRGKPPLMATEPDGRNILASGVAELIKLALAAANPQAKYPLLGAELEGNGESTLPCQYCELRGVCRVEEHQLPTATADKIDKLVNRKQGV